MKSKKLVRGKAYWIVSYVILVTVCLSVLIYISEAILEPLKGFAIAMAFLIFFGLGATLLIFKIGRFI